MGHIEIGMIHKIQDMRHGDRHETHCTGHEAYINRHEAHCTGHKTQYLQFYHCHH